MNHLPASVDGRLVDPTLPAIAPLDQGFLLGLAVFETLLWEAGCLYFVEEHLERLRDGAAELAIPWPPPTDPRTALTELTGALAQRSGAGDTPVAVRVTLSRGVPGAAPLLVITTRAVEPTDPEGVVVAISGRAKLGAAAVERVKSTNRFRNVLALEEARARGAWEALLPTEEGDFSEGTYTNLFVARAGRVWTPPLDRGCLPGITRQKVLELLADGAPVGGASDASDATHDSRRTSTGRVERGDLADADEVFLTSTLGRVIPVLRVLDLEREFPGARGPVVQALRARFTELERDYRERRP